MSYDKGHPLDGQTSECTQVTVEIARPGRRPVTRSVTIVESYNGGTLNLPAIAEVVCGTARDAVEGAYSNGRTVQI